MLLTDVAEHMDDKLNSGCQWSFMVAVVALCLDWIHHLGNLHLYDWADWRDIPYLFPRCQQSFLWHLGLSVACLQPCCHGLYLVWCSVMDRRYVEV